MPSPAVEEARNQIRGITGALLVVGITFLYTMETWWWGWTLPLGYLVGYAFIGLALIVVLTRNIGFRRGEQDGTERSEPWWSVAVDFAQILMQSFVAAYVILLVMGIVDFTGSLSHVVRLGLIEIVPLGFGAALANRLFGGRSGQRAEREGKFPENLALFALGALFVTASIAPTQEMELIATHMGWGRHVVLIALTLLLVYLILYELEFKGHQARIQQEKSLQIGTVFLAYGVAVGVSFFLLLGFGHFIDATVALVYQETVVLAFPASLGAAAAEVVI